MSRRLETVARSSGVFKSKRKRHCDNGIWQKSRAFTELWASTSRPESLTNCSVRFGPAPIVELRMFPSVCATETIQEGASSKLAKTDNRAQKVDRHGSNGPHNGATWLLAAQPVLMKTRAVSD